MLVIQVPKKEAEKEKNKLLFKGVLDHSRGISSDGEFVYFPVLKKYKTPFSFVQKKLVKRIVSRPLTLRGSLEKVLSKKEMKLVKTAYDLLGGSAILEIPEELVNKEKEIAEILLAVNPNVTTVLKKVGHHFGEFRLQKLKILAGKRTKIAEYKENGVILRLHLENVYFSPRLSTERKRVMLQVKKGEEVLVMFSGCAPYICGVGKHKQTKGIVGVEINPVAHTYALENVSRNKLKNVCLYNGDVRKIVPQLKRKFDRIVMPLPKDAEQFLDVALSVAKKGTVVHLYSFGYKKDVSVIRKGIKIACKNSGLGCRILRTVVCGQYSPKKYRFCTDFKVL